MILSSKINLTASKVPTLASHWLVSMTQVSQSCPEFKTQNAERGSIERYTFSRSHRPRQLPQQMIAITVLVRCENTSTCLSLRAQQTQICSITVSKLNLWHEIRVMEDINFVEQQTNLHDFALESFDVDEHSYGNRKLCISTCQSKRRKWREVEVLSQRTRCVTNTAIENTWLKM